MSTPSPRTFSPPHYYRDSQLALSAIILTSTFLSSNSWFPVGSRPLESLYFDVLDCPGLPVEEVVEHLGGCCKTLRHLTFCYRIPEDQHSSFAKDIIETISQWLPQLKTLYFWQEAISVKVWITFLSLTLFYLILYSNRNFPKPRMHCRDSPN